MENLSHCPIGTVAVGKKRLELCAKNGCKIQGDFQRQAAQGGTDSTAQGAGPYWSQEAWDNLVQRTNELAARCALGELAIAEMTAFTTNQKNIAGEIK